MRKVLVVSVLALLILTVFLSFSPSVYSTTNPEAYVYVQSSTVTLNGFSNPSYAYNNVTTTGATNTTTVASFRTGYLTLNFTSTVVGTKIRYMVGRSSNSSSLWTTMEITVANQTGLWFLAYNATPTYAALTYFNVTFASSTYTAIRYRFYKSTGTTSRTVTLYETQAVNASWSYPSSLNINQSAPVSLNSLKSSALSLTRSASVSPSFNIMKSLGFAFSRVSTATFNFDPLGLLALMTEPLMSGHLLNLRGSAVLTLQTLIFSSDSSDLLWLAFGGILGVVMGFVGTLFVFRSREDD